MSKANYLWKLQIIVLKLWSYRLLHRIAMRIKWDVPYKLWSIWESKCSTSAQYYPPSPSLFLGFLFLFFFPTYSPFLIPEWREIHPPVCQGMWWVQLIPIPELFLSPACGSVILIAEIHHSGSIYTMGIVKYLRIGLFKGLVFQHMTAFGFLAGCFPVSSGARWQAGVQLLGSSQPLADFR